MQTEAQRNREKRELEERVATRRSLLEQKVKVFSFMPDACFLTDFYLQMKTEKEQFQEERNERQRLLRDRQAQEIQTFDEETARLGLNSLAIAEASESIRDDASNTGSMVRLAHSNSASSFTHAAL